MTSHLARLNWTLDDVMCVGTAVVNNSDYFDSIKCLLDNMAVHINSCVTQMRKKSLHFHFCT